MDVVEVDVIRPQPFERTLDRAVNVLRPAARRLAVAHVHAELGGENDLVAATFEDLAEQPLATAPASVDVGRVEEGDAGVQGGVDDRSRRVATDAAAEIVAAQSDTRDAQIAVAELPKLHAENATVRHVPELLQVSEEIATAIAEQRAVVALETTLVAHGFPAPEGFAVGLDSERRVRAAGAVPATVGVLDGAIRVGLTEEELARFTPAARKLGPRHLAACAVQGAVGATTVGGTLAVARSLGIRFLGTGGLGGVHRGFPAPPDVSADLGELARTPARVVSSGVKSLLDVPATMEVLETLGVPVIGWRADTLPLFYTAHGGPPVSARVETASEAARIATAHWQLGGKSLLLGNPPPESIDVEPLIEAGVAEARRRRVTGQAVTPFVLSYLHEHSAGETMRVNRDLIPANAALAAEVAVAHSSL
jgi:pseudouridylate synthase